MSPDPKLTWSLKLLTVSANVICAVKLYSTFLESPIEVGVYAALGATFLTCVMEDKFLY